MGSEGASWDAFMERIWEADDINCAAIAVQMDSLDGIDDDNTDSWL